MIHPTPNQNLAAQLDGPIQIIFGSQTGCAKEVAERIYREGKRRYLPLQLVDMEDFNLQQWIDKKRMAILVISTTGQGEMPDSMRNIWKILMQRQLSTVTPPLLRKLQFCVFGLGDSSYPQFNFASKKVFSRLQNLGAVPFYLRGEGDDQHKLGLEGALDPWLEGLWKVMETLFPLPEGKNVLSADICPPPRFRITLKTSNTQTIDQKSPNLAHQNSNVNSTNSTNTNSETKSITEKHQLDSNANNTTAAASQNRTGPFSRHNPFFARVLENKRLTDPEWEQDVRFLRFEVNDPHLSNFSAGDVVEIQPQNLSEWVEQLMKVLNFDPDLWIEDLQPTDPDENVPVGLAALLPCSLRHLATVYLDIHGTPRRYFFELLSHFETQSLQKEKLQFFASSEGQDELRWYNHKEHRSPTQVFLDFPTARPPLDYIFDFFPPLQPRAFSVCSSPRVHKNEIQIVVGIVRFTTLYGRTRLGICSNYLAQCKCETFVALWTKAGAIRLPVTRPLPPLLFVGPGTGCAIFRAFLQEIESLQESERENSQHAGPIAFFFGCRSRTKDYLFETDWEGFVRRKTLSLFAPAFSRDNAQGQKVYVYHMLQKHQKEVRDLLAKPGACVYVSGNAQQMPKDVKTTLKEICGEDVIDQMVKKGLYKEDTWF